MARVIEVTSPETGRAVKASLILEFTLPLTMPSDNQWNRYYHQKQRKMKDGWALAMYGAIAAEKRVALEAVSSSYRVVETVHYRARLLDTDNLTSPCKALIIDNLKCLSYRKFGGQMMPVRGIGLIFDDDPKHAFIMQPQQKKIEDKFYNRITVRIYE